MATEDVLRYEALYNDHKMLYKICAKLISLLIQAENPMCTPEVHLMDIEVTKDHTSSYRTTHNICIERIIDPIMPSHTDALHVFANAFLATHKLSDIYFNAKLKSIIKLYLDIDIYRVRVSYHVTE